MNIPNSKSKSLAGLSAAVLLATGTLMADPTVGTGATFKGPVGLQLYSLRDSFKNDVPGTLDKVKAMGFKYVELAGTYGLQPVDFKQLLDDRGLVPVAAHFSLDLYQKDVDSIIREAKTFGVKYVGAAWIPHQGPFTMDQALTTAKTFNTIGKAVAAQGLRFYYHNHGYEFQPHLAGTLMDVLIQKTDPKYVTFQMDLLWTRFPGHDPAALLLKYPGRWELMHLKDLKKGVKGDLSGGTDVRNDVTLGTGQIDFPAVLKAARKSGVKWYFIEDESPSVEQQVPKSLEYLEQVDW
jgi:sugar phosphate isomerase/epimerase